jgi:hypothetical protein
VRQELNQFFEQVHTLALMYHWSEKDILSMPRKKRLMYVHMLQREKEK